MGKTIQVYGFPYLVAAEAVKEFLEKHTGINTVEALEVKKPRNGGPRAYAKVQFASAASADLIISLAAKKLWYGSSYLKAYSLDLNIAQKPRAPSHETESVTLYFGCQVSKENLSVLWERENVSVKFGFGLRKVYFIFSQSNIDYKFELSYENIWQIELRRPSGQRAEYLLIQLLGAPRIYENEKSLYSYYMETPDDLWARATDFTPSCRISHSSSLCLKFTHGVSLLPNFKEYFAYYTETRGPFTLRSGSTFSPNPKLAPIVGPPPEIELPYNILFKICMLVQQGCLPGPSLDTEFFKMVDPRRRNIAHIEYALERLYYSRDCCYEPVKWIDEEYQKFLRRRRLPRTPTIALDNGLVYVRRVQITPCKVYFCGPEINMSNRVLRNYPDDIDNFLRVSFLDEELDKMHSTVLSARSAFSTVGKKTSVYDRIFSTLRDGIVIGDKKFDFLAFSSSQLRENSAWMFASRPGLCAADIREWMGEFAQIRNVAKYAARLGQSFSSSTESLSVSRYEIEVIPDVEVERDGTKYTFSDGIGKISADLARRVAVKCGLKRTPSAFQIRYGGYKGVVAVDPTSSVKLSLRKSMRKYESTNAKLDILAFSKYQPCFLNRQLITLLSTLGVSDFVFEIKQREAIDELNTILTDPLRAQEALELMSPGENTNILKEMLLCGYKPDGEPFLSMMLQTFRAAKLLELRTKTRIFVPRGRSMMGCLDETRTLDYGQVFVQFSGAGHRTFCDNSVAIPGDLGSSRHIVEGKVFVAKNPCLHPGDVRVLQAVNIPALHHMVDCVVFPQKGTRPHPNECSGSDLDGDIYFVCWDPDLIPPKQIKPMDYTPAATTQLDHDVTIEIYEFDLERGVVIGTLPPNHHSLVHILLYPVLLPVSKKTQLIWV